VFQEVAGIEIANSSKEYPIDELPFAFPVYELLEEEHFGRGYVDNYIADLESLDGMSQTVQEGTAIGAILIRLVRPGGVTSKTALRDARNGDIITGVEEDIGTVRSEKSADFQASLSVMDRIVARLEKAFLTTSSVQRQAERVTAEEIRLMAAELEQQLGGAYADMVVRLQTPHALLKTSRLQSSKRMPSWQRKQVRITILTGAASLARQAKVTGVLQGLSVLAQFAPQAIQSRINIDALVALLEQAEGVSISGLLISQEEADSRAQQAALTQAAVGAAPQAVQQLGQLAQSQLPTPQE
jgi:hypothetical protein